MKFSISTHHLNCKLNIKSCHKRNEEHCLQRGSRKSKLEDADSLTPNLTIKSPRNGFHYFAVKGRVSWPEGLQCKLTFNSGRHKLQGLH